MARSATNRPKGSIPLNLTLGQAIQVAQKIHDKGGGSLRVAMLATELDNSPKSSGFGRKVACLKQHGLVEEKDETLNLTRLGLSVVAPTPEDGGLQLREALLRVPTYEFLHQRYADKVLPSVGDLTNVLIQERGLEKELAREWAEKFHQSAKDAGLVTQSGGKNILLDKPHTVGGGRKKLSEIEEGVEVLWPQFSRTTAPAEDSEAVIFHVQHGELRFSPEKISAGDLQVMINVLTAYHSKSKPEKLGK